jgi:hypothetical protein
MRHSLLFAIRAEHMHFQHFLVCGVRAHGHHAFPLGITAHSNNSVLDAQLLVILHHIETNPTKCDKPCQVDRLVASTLCTRRYLPTHSAPPLVEPT